MSSTTDKFERSLSPPKLYFSPGPLRSSSIISPRALSSTCSQSRTLEPVPYTDNDLPSRASESLAG